MDRLPHISGPVQGEDTDPQATPVGDQWAGQNSDSAGHAGPDSHQPRRRRKGQGRSREDLLEMLKNLPGAVGLGVLTPAQANSIRSIIDTILKHTQPVHSAGGGTGPLDLAQLRKLVREQPLLLDVLEPVLTDDQIDQLLGDQEGPQDAP